MLTRRIKIDTVFLFYILKQICFKTQSNDKSKKGTTIYAVLIKGREIIFETLQNRILAVFQYIIFLIYCHFIS